MPPLIYLAGPDVFSPRVALQYDTLRQLCARRGLQGVSPLDAEPGNPSTSRAIYEANIQKISRSHGVLANLSPFRSATEPDCGTAFEVGFAVALGLPVAAWLPNATVSYIERIQAAHGPVTRSDGTPRSPLDGCLVEDFGEPLNLMLAHGARIFGDAAQALDYLAMRLLPERP